MKTIAIVNRRGGVGKTATAHAIGAGLAHRGKKVLFVDLDSQTNLTYDLGVDPGKQSAMDVLTGACKPVECIQHGKSWDILPGSPSLATADAVLTNTRKEYRLAEALQQVASGYDFCIIDTPPALNTLTVNALTASAGIIIPAQAEIHSIQGIGLLNETVEQVRKYCNRDLTIYGVLITRYNDRTILSRDMRANLEQAAERLHTKTYKTPIRECVAIKEAQACQQDIFTYAPRSNAAKDYEELMKELVKDLKKGAENGSKDL